MAIINNEFWREFIEVYKREKSLWDINDEKYRIKAKRYQSWHILLKKYKEFDRHATLDTVKKRINGMRNCYRRELNKIKKSESANYGEGVIYETMLWYFNLFDFLRDVTGGEALEENDFESAAEFQKRRKSRKRKRSDDSSEYLETSIQHLDEVRNRQTKCDFLEDPEHHIDEADFQNRRESRKRKRSESGSEFLETSTQHLDEDINRQTKRDDATVFAESWAILFRKLSPKQQIYAKRSIDEILVHGQLGNLNVNSAKIKIRQRKPKANTTSCVSTPYSSPSSISDPFPTSIIHAP